MDTEAKRKLDEIIKESRMRLEMIEKEAQKLSDEEAVIRKEDAALKEKTVCIPSRRPSLYYLPRGFVVGYRGKDQGCD